MKNQPPASPELSHTKTPLETPIGTVHGEFVGEVKAAIDARFGFVSLERPSLTPMIDAPLFKLDLRRDAFDSHAFQHASLVLPQRKHADYLLGLYWEHIYPLEPFLDKSRFPHTYQALFTGEPLDCANERIFLCTLNTVFAISTQLQETLPAEQRDSESDAYFKRAWALLRLEADTLSEPATTELVRCLLLVGRYLQCTKNMHQTWMSIGLAIRTAQSLGLHKAFDDANDKQLWQCCIYMDRCVFKVLPQKRELLTTIPNIQARVMGYWTTTNGAPGHLSGD